MTLKRKNIFINLLIGFILLFTVFSVIFFSKRSSLFAQIKKEYLTTRDEFALALANKQSKIYVDDINFGDVGIAINLNYDVEIIGKQNKSLLKNVHFKVEGSTNIKNIFNIKFSNLNFDGCYNISSVNISENKSFNNMFGGLRNREDFRALTLTGLYNVQIDNCDFFKYCSVQGPTIYLQNSESFSQNSLLEINSCKFYNNVCEDGTIYLADKNLNVYFDSCNIYNNFAKVASGISLWGCKANIYNTNIQNNNYVMYSLVNSENNVAYKYGGGLFAGMCSEIYIKNSIIDNCTAFNGGGMSLTNNNKVEVDNCKILNNTAFVDNTITNNYGLDYIKGGYGGGIFVLSNEGQVVKFRNCNVANNTSEKGASVAVMPLAPNNKGGLIEFLFCNIGLNNSNDINCLEYYYYANKSENIGLLNFKGCFIVDNTTKSSKGEKPNYNYITTKEEALKDGIITQEIINNVNINGFQFLKTQKTNIKVPYKEYSLWDSSFTLQKNDKVLGINEEEKSSFNMLWIAFLLIFILIVILFSISIIVFKNKKGGALQNKDEQSCLISQDSSDFNTIAKLKNPLVLDNLEKVDVQIILDKASLNSPLSKKETEVFELMLQNKHRKEIASKMFVTEHTVKKHLANIYVKFDVSGKKELKQKIISLLNN